jgi:hypothetical protein
MEARRLPLHRDRIAGRVLLYLIPQEVVHSIARGAVRCRDADAPSAAGLLEPIGNRRFLPLCRGDARRRLLVRLERLAEITAREGAGDFLEARANGITARRVRRSRATRMIRRHDWAHVDAFTAAGLCGRSPAEAGSRCT